MKFKLHIKVSLGALLMENGQCDRLYEILLKCAPAWSRGLLIKKHEVHKAYDAESNGDFTAAVQEVSTSRGPLYRALMERSASRERIFGDADITGMNPSLRLSLHHDEFVLMRYRTGEVNFMNRVVAYVERKNVDAVPVAQWAVRFLSEVCAHLDVWHAHAEVQEQYDAKNISRKNGFRALGLDATRHLPGLYWLNYFGPPYRDLIGAERLLGAPAHRATSIGQGVLLEVHPDPEAWSGADYAARERGVLAHLGEQYFFDLRKEERPTVAPDFSGIIQNPPPL